MFKYLILIAMIISISACDSSKTPVGSGKSNSDVQSPSSGEAPKAATPEKPKDRTLISKLKVEKDEMREVSFYYHPKAAFSPSTKIKLYLSESKNGLAARFVMEYWSDHWLFVERAWTKIDGVEYDLPSEARWNRDNGSSFIWETSDSYLNKTSLSLIKKLAYADSPTIRFEGSKYYKDFKPSKSQLQMMKDMIAAYEAAVGIEIE